MSNESKKSELYSYPEIATQVREFCDVINSLLQDNGENDKIKYNIDQLIQHLKSLEIDSYEFTYGANQAAQNLDNKVCNFLLEKIANFSADNDNDKNVERADAFIAYYLVAYLYRLHDSEKLGEFLEKYETLFIKHYALTYQIRGRELRAKGKLQDAIQNDHLALEMLDRKKIDNIGVRITLASSIATALESRERGIEHSDIESSINDVKKAIQMNRLYPRYYYLIAKIKLYQTKNEVYMTDYENKTLEKWSEKKDAWNSELAEAYELIRQALELLDNKTSAYPIFFTTYTVIKDRIEKLQTEIELLGVINGQIQEFKDQILNEFEKIINVTKEKNEEMIENVLQQERAEIEKNSKEALTASREKIENDMQNALQKSQVKYLEILAVFVAIVGVMVTTSGLVTQNFSFREVILGIIVMNAAILAVYTCFKMILSKEIHRLYVTILFITCVVMLLSLVFGDCHIWLSLFWRIK